MSQAGPLPIGIILGVIVFWLGIALVGLAAQRRFRLVSQVLFPLGGAGALVLAGAAFAALGQAPASLVLPLGLPDLPFHLRLDALSAFFLVLLGGTSFAISIFSAGYFRQAEGTPPGLLCLQYHMFLASMAGVLLADDAYLFMVAWETMALSSYFLVTTNHRIPEIRWAGFLYLLIAHVGAIAILLCFGAMQGFQGDYTFAAMRQAHLSGFWASVTFLLALFGFGAKAGLLPVHVWLPEAHPAAPSPVSAMMSGVMLKTAVYGLLRVTFDLLDTQLWWWGVLALGLGLITALYGVMFAAVQADMKRLLAYSSVENIGIIVAGVGLAIVFRAYGMNTLSALAMTAALYHCLNHAFFKSLLFLATGHVLHATGERNLGKLGGLIHRMPWVAIIALVGTLAIASLPPLNGFVSEWLLLQAFLFSPDLPNPYLHMLIPSAAGALVLAAALAGYVMVKFYGVIFLGRPREDKLAQAHDAGNWEKAGLLWLAAGCLLLGIFPVYVIAQLDFVTVDLIGRALGDTAGKTGWLFLTPVAPERASYSPLLFLVVIAVGVGFTYWMVRMFYHGRLRRGDPWDCGYPAQTPRMQDTAEGFGQPIRQIFEPFFVIERELPTPFDGAPRYRMTTRDRLWHWVYLPVARLAERMTSLVAVLQQGRIHVYLMYSFGTLLLLLLFAR
ncbi:MAG: hydrogenase 4 subunit B [Betaproteobacteria bacterium]|nr:hydrogenase 4 subunit B [Betaproteobacteria bacterium]